MPSGGPGTRMPFRGGCLGAALALLALAGCVAEPDPVPAPPVPGMVTTTVAVAAGAAVHTSVLCPPLVSCLGTKVAAIGEVPEGHTLVGFALDVTVSRLPGSPFGDIELTLRCTGAAECAAPLAQEQGPGPFRLAGNVSLPAGTVLEAVGRALDQDTADPLGFLAPSIDVAGTLTLVGHPLPEPVRQARPFELQGNTGPCAILVECSSGPWYFDSLGPWTHPVQGLAANLTWAAQTPLSETLRIRISCRGQCEPQDVVVEGTSPLSVAAPGFSVPPDASIDVRVEETYTPDIVRMSFGHQPFTITGHVVELVPPPAPEVADGRRTARDA